MRSRSLFSRPLPRVLPIEDEEVEAVTTVMRNLPLTTLFGDGEVERFEQEFVKLFDGVHAVAVTSGTTALLASLMAAGIGPGDEVIVTPFSFVASVSVVVQIGATPVFADIDPETLVMDPKSVQRVLTPRTRAVLPVHQCGYPVDLVELRTIVPSNVLIIEDAAAAHGALVHGRFVGTIGDFGCFSFNIGKIMRTGEGGMVLTGNAEAATKLRSVRVNGLVPSTMPNGTWVARLGCNFTMMQMVAAIGRIQIKRFPDFSLRRRSITMQLAKALEGLPVRFSPDRPGLQRAYYSVPLILAPHLECQRMEIARAIQDCGVPIGTGNPQLLHQLDYIRPLTPQTRCPCAETVCKRLLFFDPLPIYTDEEVDGIAQAIREVLQQYHS